MADARGPISSTELSRRLGLEKTRTNRILKTLAYMGFAHQTRSRRYTSGPAMHILSGLTLASSGLLATSFHHLESLTDLNLIVALGVLWMDKVSYLFHHAPGTPFLEGIGRTRLHPAAKSSLGMALLAEKSDEEVAKVYSRAGTLDGYPDIDSLLDELRRIRERGFAALSEYDGHHTIAVKIGTPAFAAIGLSGEIDDEEVRKYAATLADKAESIEEELCATTL